MYVPPPPTLLTRAEAEARIAALRRERDARQNNSKSVAASPSTSSRGTLTSVPKPRHQRSASFRSPGTIWRQTQGFNRRRSHARSASLSSTASSANPPRSSSSTFDDDAHASTVASDTTVADARANGNDGVAVDPSSSSVRARTATASLIANRADGASLTSATASTPANLIKLPADFAERPRRGPSPPRTAIRRLLLKPLPPDADANATGLLLGQGQGQGQALRPELRQEQLLNLNHDLDVETEHGPPPSLPPIRGVSVQLSPDPDIASPTSILQPSTPPPAVPFKSPKRVSNVDAVPVVPITTPRAGMIREDMETGKQLGAMSPDNASVSESLPPAPIARAQSHASTGTASTGSAAANASSFAQPDAYAMLYMSSKPPSLFSLSAKAFSKGVAAARASANKKADTAAAKKLQKQQEDGETEPSDKKKNKKNKIQKRDAESMSSSSFRADDSRPTTSASKPYFEPELAEEAMPKKLKKEVEQDATVVEMRPFQQPHLTTSGGSVSTRSYMRQPRPSRPPTSKSNASATVSIRTAALKDNPLPQTPRSTMSFASTGTSSSDGQSSLLVPGQRQSSNVSNGETMSMLLERGFFSAQDSIAAGSSQAPTPELKPLSKTDVFRAQTPLSDYTSPTQSPLIAAEQPPTDPGRTSTSSDAALEFYDLSFPRAPKNKNNAPKTPKAPVRRPGRPTSSQKRDYLPPPPPPTLAALPAPPAPPFDAKLSARHDSAFIASADTSWLLTDPHANLEAIPEVKPESGAATPITTHEASDYTTAPSKLKSSEVPTSTGPSGSTHRSRHRRSSSDTSAHKFASSTHKREPTYNRASFESDVSRNSHSGAISHRRSTSSSSAKTSYIQGPIMLFRSPSQRESEPHHSQSNNLVRSSTRGTTHTHCTTDTRRETPSPQPPRQPHELEHWSRAVLPKLPPPPIPSSSPPKSAPHRPSTAGAETHRSNPHANQSTIIRPLTISKPKSNLRPSSSRGHVTPSPILQTNNINTLTPPLPARNVSRKDGKPVPLHVHEVAVPQDDQSAADDICSFFEDFGLEAVGSGAGDTDPLRGAWF